MNFIKRVFLTITRYFFNHTNRLLTLNNTNTHPFFTKEDQFEQEWEQSRYDLEHDETFNGFKQIVLSQSQSIPEVWYIYFTEYFNLMRIYHQDLCVFCLVYADNTTHLRVTPRYPSLSNDDTKYNICRHCYFKTDFPTLSQCFYQDCQQKPVQATPFCRDHQISASTSKAV